MYSISAGSSRGVAARSSRSTTDVSRTFAGTPPATAPAGTS